MSAATASSQQAKRRQLMLLAVLGLVLAGLVVFVLVPALSGGSGTPQPVVVPRPATAPAGVRPNAQARREVVDVHLDRLKAAPPDPNQEGRNPFRMGPAPPPPGAAAAAEHLGPRQQAQPMGPPGPPAPPPLPPIPYKFIGIVTGNARTGKIAVLSDGRHVVSVGEGKEVDGRFRVVKIGEESIQMEYIDGRGRQTIRLSGQ